MKKKLFVGISLLSLAISIGVCVNGFEKDAPMKVEASSYWTSWINENSTTINNGGASFLDALQTKISDATTISYDGLKTAYKTSDAIPGSNGQYIYDVYGGFQFTFTTSIGTYKNEGDVYNREHSVPKSWFSENKPAYSDLIHVIPADGKINGYRSNYAFGEVQTADYSFSFPARSYNGYQYQEAGVSKKGSPKSILGVTPNTSTVFEPDDQYKGDFARIYMYFAVRYGNTSCQATSGDGGKIFSSNYPYLTTYGKALVKKWHEQDPVSEKELTRNDAVESLQGNRNPFVDYPSWADKIFDTNYGGEDGGDTPITPTLDSISVKTAPNKLTYTEGEKFDPTGLVITRSYSDGNEDTLSYSGNTSLFTFSPSLLTSLTTSHKSITITVGGKSTTQAITVNPVSSGGDDSGDTNTPTRTVYETQDVNELVGSVDYSSGSEKCSTGISTSKSGYTTTENNSLRMGSGSQLGTLTINSDNSFNVIKAKIQRYGSDTGVNITIGEQNHDIEDVSSYNEYVTELDTSVKEISISTTAKSKRIYVESVYLYTIIQGQVDITNTQDVIGLEYFVDTYMHMDDYKDNLGWCKDNEHHYYASAKSYFVNNLNNHQRQLFVSNIAFKDEFDRFSSWAYFNGDSIGSDGKLSTRNNINIINDNNLNYIILISGLVITFSSATLLFVYKKKKNVK